MSEFVKAQEIIRELANKQQTSPIDLLASTPEWILKTPPVAMQETASVSYTIPSSIYRFLNDDFISAVLSKHDVLYLKPMKPKKPNWSV
jgi:hypothetical protein